MASSLLALAATSTLDQARRPSSVSPEELAAQASSVIARLSARQTTGGGFGMDSEDDLPDGYLSAYVLHALCAARAAGFDLDESHLERDRAFLVEHLLGNDALDPDGTPDDLAFALRALAEAGSRDDARITQLFDQRERLFYVGMRGVRRVTQRVQDEIVKPAKQSL